jgi:hypothetical protein
MVRGPRRSQVMSESEWLGCSDPTILLDFLADTASDRKLQLVGSACHRRIPARDAVRWEQLRRGGKISEETGSCEVASHERKELVRTRLAAENAVAIVTCGINRKTERQAAAAAERTAQCRLLRDIFGNPFVPITIDSSWLTWSDSIVVKMAGAIYEDRGFDRMPVLADALEKAGCTDAAILDHCRGPGPHVRGCWVVDRLLGKE